MAIFGKSWILSFTYVSDREFSEVARVEKTPQDKADLETDLNDDTTEKKVLQKKVVGLISFFELFFGACGGDDKVLYPLQYLGY